MNYLHHWNLAFICLRTNDFEGAALNMESVLTDPELPHFLVPLAKQEWETCLKIAKQKNAIGFSGKFANWMTAPDRRWNKAKGLA